MKGSLEEGKRNSEITKNREQKRKVNQSSPNVTTGNQYKEKEKEKEKDKDKDKEKEKASAFADPVADAADVLTIYNSICVSLPKESVLTEEAVSLIMRSPQVDFEDYFKRIERSDFLTGSSGRISSKYRNV